MGVSVSPIRTWIFPNERVLSFMLASLVAMSCVPVSRGGAGQLEYYNLVDDLFSSYNKNVRPTTAGELTEVRIQLILKSIVDLDEKNQILESYATLDIQWEDDYLIWDPANYGNISRILYPQKQMWVPDIINENSVESQVQMGYDQLMCAITSDGTIQWRPSEIFKTSCDIDVSYYPFDSQVCRLTYTTMMSTKDEIDIDPFGNNDSVILSEYTNSATWKLVDTSVATPDINDEFTRIEFTLTLKRLRLYYAMNIVMPLLVLSMTSSAVFYLPPESGEKVGMAITILLSYTVYLTIVAEKMPETSAQVSLLEVYIAIQLTLSALSVILSVLILNLHHREADIPVSMELQRRTRLWRRTFGLGPPHVPIIHRNQIDPVNNKGEGRTALHLRRPQTIDPLEDTDYNSNSHNKYDVDSQTPITNSPEEITWIKVAETLDRVMFIIYTVIIFSITLILIPIMVLLGEMQ